MDAGPDIGWYLKQAEDSFLNRQYGDAERFAFDAQHALGLSGAPLSGELAMKIDTLLKRIKAKYEEALATLQAGNSQRHLDPDRPQNIPQESSLKNPLAGALGSAVCLTVEVTAASAVIPVAVALAAKAAAPSASLKTNLGQFAKPFRARGFAGFMRPAKSVLGKMAAPFVSLARFFAFRPVASFGIL